MWLIMDLTLPPCIFSFTFLEVDAVVHCVSTSILPTKGLDKPQAGCTKVAVRLFLV
jgi:hypothetical protein